MSIPDGKRRLGRLVAPQNRRRAERERKSVRYVYNGLRFMVPKEVLADRDARADRIPRDLTAEIFGDPLPGRSALDQLRARGLA